MKRRIFVASMLAGGVAAPTLIADKDHDHDDHLSGPQANATVTFGSWHSDSTPGLDRFLAATPPPANVHHVLPFEAQIKAGGSVNFIISGFHILAIYSPGVDFEDVNGTLTKPIPGAPTGPPAFPPVVDDPSHRVYRGVNPFDLPQGRFGPPLDRSEAVNFANPGRYLVICAFKPHFDEMMHGYVKVLK